jgi:hypothetical protein
MELSTVPAPALQPTGASRRLPAWKRYVHLLLGREISALTRYYDRTIHWLPRSEDDGTLLQSVDCPQKQVVSSELEFPDLTHEVDERTVVLVNGTFNHHFDIQGLLTGLKARLSRSSRVVVVLYNPYLRALYALANKVGIRSGELPTTFITRVDLDTLSAISGYAIVRERPVVYCPFSLLGLGNLINRVLPAVPVLRMFSFAFVVVLRPVIKTKPKSLSCVIPARNERGNIENALKRLENFPCPIEVIFVEGHSSDGTWEEIQRVAEAYKDRFKLQIMQQTGKGKNDAVRLGFSAATESLLVILDADLTMPPEMLERFYFAYCAGLGDFVNGSRLVYPMEGEAMRFLNRLGNVFFAKLLSFVLDVRIGDSLCGTKLLSKRDYQRILAWRGDFGDFDPFGDFELLFPAAILGFGIVDVPIRYLARTYGSTNIQRFRHGWLLLKMTAIGLFRIKMR